MPMRCSVVGQVVHAAPHVKILTLATWKTKLSHITIESWPTEPFQDCTIEPRSSFEFPSRIKVRNVRRVLLQLCRHHQQWASTQAFRARYFREVRHRRELLSPCSWLVSVPDHFSPHRERDFGTGAERSQTCGAPPVQGFTNSESSQFSSLVSSDAFTPLVHYIQSTF